MAFLRDSDGPGIEEERRAARGAHLGTGTLACPECDAPVALATGRAAPTDALHCPYCRHSGAAREFLSLTHPARPTRVEVRVVGYARMRRIIAT